MAYAERDREAGKDGKDGKKGKGKGKRELTERERDQIEAYGYIVPPKNAFFNSEKFEDVVEELHKGKGKAKGKKGKKGKYGDLKGSSDWSSYGYNSSYGKPEPIPPPGRQWVNPETNQLEELPKDCPGLPCAMPVNARRGYPLGKPRKDWGHEMPDNYDSDDENWD